MLEDIRASGDFDLTTLPVALREVRDLLERPPPYTVRAADERAAVRVQTRMRARVR